MPRFAKSKHPVGALWEATGTDGSRAAIQLVSRDGGLEVWRWSFCLSDGSGHEGDWGPSYAACQKESGYRVGGARFHRVKL